MRVVVQRVSKASVEIDGRIEGSIQDGLLAFVGINRSDDENTIKWMSNKLCNLRIFPDNAGKMNRSVIDINGGLLVISNFTLYGDAKKGFRPNFLGAAPPDISEPMYDKMIDHLKQNYDLNIQTGRFGAMMNVNLTNAGPVTIIIDKENDK